MVAFLQPGEVFLCLSDCVSFLIAADRVDIFKERFLDDCS